MRQIKILLFFLLPLTLASCNKGKEQELLSIINQSLDRATVLALDMAKALENDSSLLPRSFENGELLTSDSRWWCSGFFPGVLWYLYENNPSEEIKEYALDYTNRVKREQYATDNHDTGFIMYCSFGNGLRLLGKEKYKDVLLQTSHSLSTRYNKSLKLIRSWDWNEKVWQYPVIIDNMMNLEMLLWAAKESGDTMFEEIARNHADKTMIEHFRPNYSSYHLVDYDTITGNVRRKQTVQGYADSSSWARGQAWAVYGYTMMYRETGDSKYLAHAENIALFILTHPHLPKDKIPYWDFDAPDIPEALRDASAAAIMSSAFIELAVLTNNKKLSDLCLHTAEIQLRTLSSPEYLAEPGTNGNFILKHSVGSIPGNHEMDVPLTYADYYYVEALMRYKKHF